eukprot:Mrub_02370.p1 GENE.Mrub_02370~~Mrub_02370.p1  ORF type:complete len:550 (+),score=120.15 Mrub_02370:234-1652(+)
MLKVYDTETNMDIDFIHLHSDPLWRAKDELVKQCVEFDGRILQVCRMLKKWRFDNLEYLNPKYGFPNNYGFQVMLFYVLIRNYILPKLKYKNCNYHLDENFKNNRNYKMSPDEIWLKMLEFMMEPDTKEIIDLRHINYYDKYNTWLIWEPVGGKVMTCNTGEQPKLIALRAKKEYEKLTGKIVDNFNGKYSDKYMEKYTYKGKYQHLNSNPNEMNPKVNNFMKNNYECVCCFSKFIESQFTFNTCNHKLCNECFIGNLQANANEIVYRLKLARNYNIKCFMYECNYLLAPELIENLPNDIDNQNSNSHELNESANIIAINNANSEANIRKLGINDIKNMLIQLSNREYHINNKPDNCNYIECKHMDCVGICYNDELFPRCKLCSRYTYNQDYSVLTQIWTRIKNTCMPEHALDGIDDWRACPHCGIAIDKIGGCNNMRCAVCLKVFWWGEFENSKNGVIEAHAPRIKDVRKK